MKEKLEVCDLSALLWGEIVYQKPSFEHEEHNKNFSILNVLNKSVLSISFSQIQLF